MQSERNTKLGKRLQLPGIEDRMRSPCMPTRGVGEEAVGEAEEDLEDEEVTPEGETKEIEEGRNRTNRRSPASTVEERGTRPPLVQVPRSLEGKDAMRRKGVVKEKAGKPLQ